MGTVVRISLVALFFMLVGFKFAGAQTIAVFGDSITEGYGLASPSTQNWTADLLKLLPDTYSYGFDGGEIGATLQINPVAGPSYQKDNNSGILLASLNSNIFFVMLGTNDGKTVNQAGTTANFVSDYETLLNRIKGSSSKPSTIYLITPPPAFSNGFTIDPAFVNGTVKTLVESLNGFDGAHVIDINDSLMSAFSNGSGGYSTTYLLDGIHPTVTGDQQIADAIYDAAFVVPEPSSFALLVPAGIALMLGARCRFGFSSLR